MLEAYRKNGFVYLDRVFDADDVSAMNAALASIVATCDDDTKLIRERDAETIRTVVNPHLWSPHFDRLTRHPALLSAVTTLLGEPVYAWQMGINRKAALKGDMWFWHQDYPAYRVDDHIPEPRMVNALIFLDEVTHANGPLMIVPGSHRIDVAPPPDADHGTSYAFRYAEPELIERAVADGGIEIPTGPAGSVILMDVNALHGSGPNLSPWTRGLITLTYNAMSNKATAPSKRAAHIVPDDRDVPALTPLSATCLKEPTS